MVIVVVARDLVVVIVSIAMVELWRVARMMPQGAVVVTALVTGRRTGLRPSLPNFPRSRVPQKMRLVGVEGYGRCRHCSCYRQEDRAASLSNFPRSRVEQKRRLVVVEEKENPSITGST